MPLGLEMIDWELPLALVSKAPTSPVAHIDKPAPIPPKRDPEIPSCRKRKRSVPESQDEQYHRADDLRRPGERVDSKPAQIGRPGGVVVNLDPHIAERVKPHQLEGIQFMWRAIVEDPSGQGCILAHTMGLGKTMQAIALLVTIAQCRRSGDPRTRGCLPEPLQTDRTLILCPAALLENWADELQMWSPSTSPLGGIHKLTKTDEGVIETWVECGGILLLSYDRFKRIIGEDEPGLKTQPTASAKVAMHLLEGPGLVVADEAHAVKDPNTHLARAMKKFKTSRRIALTGSPLNNHLEEYHTMVDWVAPGYLGNTKQFRAKYATPIQNGLYVDSGQKAKMQSLKKLRVLERYLDPKIHGADISVVANEMPSKTEFFLTIPLTELQKEAYNICVDFALGGAAHERSGRTNLWEWVNVLQLLCNHPSCCVDKLRARGRERRGDPVSATAGLDEMRRKVVEVFQAVDAAGELQSAELSYRTALVRDIVQAARNEGDKTLIFSHNLPSLDYLGHMLSEIGCEYFRLDGQTEVPSRQSMVKTFNRRDDDHDVFLISTRAGALGLNIQGANRIIIFDFSFNPSWEDQAIGRAYRLGQTKPVFVYRFRAGGTFEDVMFNQAIFKTQMSQRVVHQKYPVPHASRDVSRWLFPVREVDKRPFRGHPGKGEKDSAVLEGILGRVDYVQNVELTEIYQRPDDERLNEEEIRDAEAEVVAFTVKP
ncbi:uncharacterized protein A1O9_12908 [Exophiala aquamarina CBS 119918]|uniref:Adenosinetriphosphatase n=1 Tax=Exophiala aquamarina CBS 119918 TaxID=1182545 RepID=A0A072NT25_9EURO|nr:uncharacterized protein A1O9_12908 [Exophiala aquamarina CBS 119918]KEF51024.1 hypothetical protein A1O9_12908 [Exophiala aquamarina CBS 119918]